MTAAAPGRRGGRSTAELVRRLLDEPYYSLPPPKSTGKEHFHLGYVTSRWTTGTIPTRPTTCSRR